MTTDQPQFRVVTERRVVICGSMSFYGEMLRIQDELLEQDVKSITPDAEDEIRPTLTLDQFEKFKRRVSYAYLRKIRDPRTYALLAVNPDKYGIEHYIGPNTFAEIAVAFAQSKRIYVLQDFPEMYQDELQAWGASQLFGSLNELVRDYRLTCVRETAQLKLFP